MRIPASVEIIPQAFNNDQSSPNEIYICIPLWGVKMVEIKTRLRFYTVRQ